MSFWNYSNEIYRITNVPDACLRLQNEYSLDVNMVLFCCWHGSNFGKMDENLFIQCQDFSDTWASNSVKPLRGIRTWLKLTGCLDQTLDVESCMNFRHQVKKVELASEKFQQESLEKICNSLPNPDLDDLNKTKGIAYNLKLYLTAKNVNFSDDIYTDLEFLAQKSIKEFNSNLFKQTLHTL